ncbi:hypothetical protein [Spirillospora sp. NPDC048819]|uniref:hypothetical protein n=1 Tax=Spirillospora sp. NPDC048819 TaxID=3155268 RepID=UPI0033D5F926
MRATQLAAAGFAAGAMVLGMAGPALATPGDPVTPGAPCSNVGATAENAAGELMKCIKKAGEEKATWQPAAPGDENPTPTPTPTTPTFKFGYDKVKLSTTRVAPGQNVTFTVTCPTSVTVAGNGYTKNPLPVKKAGENTFTAQGTYRSNLPDPTTVTVVCKDFGSVKYSTSPEKAEGSGNGNGNGMAPKTPKVPTGPINTGDGSSLGTGGSPMMAAAWGVFAFLGLGAVALRRRTVSERS